MNYNVKLAYNEKMGIYYEHDFRLSKNLFKKNDIFYKNDNIECVVISSRKLDILKEQPSQDFHNFDYYEQIVRFYDHDANYFEDNVLHICIKKQ